MDIARNDYGFPTTDERVPLHTSDTSNNRIHERTLRSLRRYMGASKHSIDERINTLQREWDIERTLEANAAAVAVAGLALGVAVDKRFLAIPALVGGFLLQHAIQGWCPPLPMLRRMGVRTSSEIHTEILALRIMRGDFNAPATSAKHAFSLASQT